MKLPSFKLSWDTTASTARLAMIACACTSVATLGLTIKIMMDHERVILVPPNMTQQAQVGWESASQNYYKSWGLFIATMIGSITPRTAAFTAQQLEPFFDAPLWPRVATQILSIADDPNYAHNGTLNVFTPRAVFWEPSTAKVYITGLLDTTAYRNSALPVAELTATYEMRFMMRSGVPKVTYFNSYTGEPRTLKWLSNHKGDPALKPKPGPQTTSILPQESDIAAQIQSQQAAEIAAEASAASASMAANASASGVAAAPTASNAEKSTPIIGASAASGAHL
ncbi:sex pilus assembly protein TraE [Burkholderia cenocepacia]|uniref:TraE/TraK family type IV conjugative transfer system protein n=1 Tax=Burkholderia cenocepacia TaxID=95486 RepID=UPI001B9B9EAF|nr:TraE/TraK family type IV conjugative transfer system protein [Burkholderia cenocepacia]MBR8043106.1 sex pilus assembly protein TraE [Burkholderia cenocepacia]MBR8324524.1 sex pilus assembly protein TraE [Burkholderia cenocepacia]